MKQAIDLAKSLFLKNKYQEVIDNCDKILTIDVNSIEALKLKAKSLLAKKRIEEARFYFNKVIDIKSDDYESIKDLGNTYQITGDNIKAKNYYQKSIEINSSYAPALTNLGSIEMNIGNREEALTQLIKATDADPKFAKGWGNLVNGYIQLGKVKEAEFACKKNIELNPNVFSSHFLLAKILIKQKKLKEAEQPLLKTIQLNPDLLQAYLNLGAILKDLGKLKEAEFYILKAIQINPSLPEAHYMLGSIFQSLGNLRQAELFQRKAIKINPYFQKAYIKLSEVLVELNNSEEAFISEWNAIKLNPSYIFLKSYREKAKVINKTAFYINNYGILNHFKPTIESNPNFFELVVSEKIDKEKIEKIRNTLSNKNIIIRSSHELIKNNLYYEKLISSNGFENINIVDNKNNGESISNVPIIKLLGKKNIRFMYTAGKDKWTLSYWNKLYDGILCYGPYHQNKFNLRHKVPTAQMGYPRFDKYFNPGFDKNYLLKKFKCEPEKKTIVWIPTWTNLSSVDKYIREIASLKRNHNIVVRPHPLMKENDPKNYKKLFTLDFNYVDDIDDNDNVQLFALADLMLFDYGGSMFGSLYLNKNFVFLDMNLEAKNHFQLGKISSEDYLKSFFPDRIAKLENLKLICDYCLKNPPANSIMKSLREEFFNTNYQGTSGKRAYELLINDNWIK